MELDTLQKQEEGIHAQLDKEVAKLDTISIESENTKAQIKKEKDSISSELSEMIKQSTEYDDIRDGLQSDIYKLQKNLKIITSKKNRLGSQLSDRVMNTAERVSMLEERIIYKNTDDYLSFVIEGLGRVDPELDQNIICILYTYDDSDE